MMVAAIHHGECESQAQPDLKHRLLNVGSSLNS
jgi:hypothetical protein